MNQLPKDPPAPAAPATNSEILSRYIAMTKGSAARYTKSVEVFPSGVTHDGRYIPPHPIYVTHAKGSRKWDVDGNEYVDYVGGHGALLLGHTHPEVMLAVVAQATRGTHLGANGDLELRWGELVREMVPSAEMVRFTGSGTEASMMAFRLARTFTGKTKIVRFRGHFHGWHDHVAFGVTGHFDGSPTPGVPAAVAAETLLCDPNDGPGVTALLEGREDIAAVIIEPTGSTYGQVPIRPEFLKLLRELTRRRGVVLIFDEVVTGFRVSPGGAQAEYGIVPDMTLLAKILAGGLPGGAVVGRRDIMEALDFVATAKKGREKIHHPGTYNANPLSAAAGVATLEIIRDTDANARARAYAQRWRDGVRAIVIEEGLPWGVYGTFTGCHIFTNPEGMPIDPRSFDPYSLRYDQLKIKRGGTVVTRLRLAMRLEGVDIAPWPGGPASATHTDRDLDQTLSAFRVAVRMLKAEGEIIWPKG
ncbi:MAG: aspartate aminotransferase family protein [Alphaproteobacteria bacterium]|nr:aspartate aminotransferase family protein [Alphaproteobacteria bacterium]